MNRPIVDMGWSAGGLDLPNLWGVGAGGWTNGDGQGDWGNPEAKYGELSPIEAQALALAILGVPRVTQEGTSVHN